MAGILKGSNQKQQKKRKKKKSATIAFKSIDRMTTAYACKCICIHTICTMLCIFKPAGLFIWDPLESKSVSWYSVSWYPFSRYSLSIHYWPVNDAAHIRAKQLNKPSYQKQKVSLLEHHCLKKTRKLNYATKTGQSDTKKAEFFAVNRSQLHSDLLQA